MPPASLREALPAGGHPFSPQPFAGQPENPIPMNKPLLSCLILLGLASHAQAENLIDIYRLALEKDPQLLSTKALRDQAFAKIGESRAAMLPQINLGADLGYQKSNMSNQQTAAVAGASLGLSQALYRRSNWLNSDLSAKAATQADVGYNLEKQGLILRSAQAYFAVLAARDKLEYVQANEQALQRQLEETQQRYNVGMIAITDVHEAKAAHDLATADVIVAENALTNSLETLRQLTGRDHRALDGLNTERFAPAPLGEPVSHWMRLAEEENLNLHRQRIAKDIAKQQIDLAQTGHEPTLDLTSGLDSTYSEYENSAYTDGTLNQASVGLNFTLPLYNGGAVDARVQQAQYGFVAASEQLEGAFRQVQADLYRTYNNVHASIGTVRAFQQSVISAESALTATRAGYEVGTRTVVDLLDATSKLYSAKQQLSDARYNYILGTLQLKQTAGSLNEQDLLEINQGLSPQPAQG